ncbi:hypothetical protein J4Q44_G00329680 [Coregonus suidteri]|uniref:Uncharacterized protein n=1 Tax=Coregonus suidteri TaxID=861788 RepID=A0AAN8QFC9_9TELE
MVQLARAVFCTDTLRERLCLVGWMRVESRHTFQFPCAVEGYWKTPRHKSPTPFSNKTLLNGLDAGTHSGLGYVFCLL